MQDGNAGLNKFPNLFKARKIGKYTASNAVKYAACSVSNFNNPDGSITEREFGRMQVICRTGAGIITNQGAYPDAAAMGKAYLRQISISGDEFIPGLTRVSDMIHDAGALALQQILHAGRYGGIHEEHCLQPSDVPQSLPHFKPPQRMSAAQIESCIQDHVAAADRAIRAGFDGVEITAFMGYLLASFLSPYTNDRTDEYGGTLEKRGRFMVDLIKATKSVIGDRMFWIRLNATELMDDRGGNSEEDCLAYMKMAEEAGADAISVVIGWHESTKGALGRDLPTDVWLYLAEAAKRELGIPLAFGPRFGDPIMAEQAIAEGKIDFWEVCRPFLADPELLIKVKEDRLPEIKPCLGGLMCLSRMFRNLPYLCTVNPQLGHEYDPAYSLAPSPQAKSVFVIGGGPAGMEAAVTAARRGHRVTLFEKESSLGGQLKAAATEIEGGQIFTRLIDYYRIHLKKYGVEVRLGSPVKREMISKVRPDVGIVATGATVGAPALPGIESAQVIFADRFSEKDYVTGKRVLVIGGERAGLVVAERLAREGNDVVIVDQGKRLAGDVIPTFKWRHISWIKELGIEVIKNTRAVAVSGAELQLVDHEEQKSVRPFDILVVTGPRVPVNSLTNDLLFSCDELYTVGDAISPRNICDAIHEGYKLATRI